MLLVDNFFFSRFIEKYGTHIVVGVKMGGKDVVHVKQLQNSNLPPNELRSLLKKLANERFSEDVNRISNSDARESSEKTEVNRNSKLQCQFFFSQSLLGLLY